MGHGEQNLSFVLGADAAKISDNDERAPEKCLDAMKVSKGVCFTEILLTGFRELVLTLPEGPAREKIMRYVNSAAEINDELNS